MLRKIIYPDTQAHRQNAIISEESQVAAMDEMSDHEELNLVHPCLPDARICNWEFKDLPMVYTDNEM